MSSSSMSPSWIAGGSSRLRMEHFNLWPSTSVTASSPSAAATWAAYSSALATLTLNQLNEVKYPHHRGPSPLTPTTPTYAPDSPSSIIGHADIQPDSPHSVDYHPDSYTDYPVDPADYCLTTSLNPRKQKRSQSSTVVAYPASKKKKSFTIDSILGLDSEQQQQQPQMFNKPVTHAEETLPECRETSTSPVANPSASPSVTCLSSNSASPRTKRVRTIFSAEQLERLEAEFARQQYMVGPERLLLAASLRLTESQVKVWFQNRRIKWRKQHLEAQQMRLVSWRQQHGASTASDDEQSESYSD